MVVTMTKKEINALKAEVKKATGRNMTDIEIVSVSDTTIEYGYYASKYDRVTGRLTREEIER